MANETIFFNFQAQVMNQVDLYLGQFLPIAQTLIILISGYALSKLFAFIGKKTIHLFTRHTECEVDDIIVENSYRCASKIFFLGAIYVALIPLQLSDRITLVVGRAMFSLIAIYVAWYGVRMLDGMAMHWGHKLKGRVRIKNFQDTILPFTRKISRFFAFVIVFIIVLSIWGINVGPMLASLGVAGIVIGFALKDTLGNIFGGLSLILDNAYKRGDRLELPSGQIGIVSEVGLRSTRVKLFDGHMVMVPNGVMANSYIINYNLPNVQQRVVVDFGVAYGTKHEKVKKLLEPKLAKLDHVTKEQLPAVEFISMGDWALNFKAYIWVGTVDQTWDTKLTATKLIYDELNRAKISIPFPTQEIKLKK